jgi:hypothetical protein
MTVALSVIFSRQQSTITFWSTTYIKPPLQNKSGSRFLILFLLIHLNEIFYLNITLLNVASLASPAALC